MKFFTLVAVVAAATAMSGCMTAEKLAARDDATCQSYGAKPTSDIYVQCRMAQDQTRAQQQMARAQGAMAGQQAYWNTYNAVRQAGSGFTYY